MSKLCQNVLPIAKKQIKTKIRTNKQKKNCQGIKPDAKPSSNCSESNPNLILGSETEVLLIC